MTIIEIPEIKKPQWHGGEETAAERDWYAAVKALEDAGADVSLVSAVEDAAGLRVTEMYAYGIAVGMGDLAANSLDMLSQDEAVQSLRAVLGGAQRLVDRLPAMDGPLSGREVR
jgi:hypothetical protein